MKLTGQKENKTATRCTHCNGTGREPNTPNIEQRICSYCLGMQYVDSTTSEAFDDFDSARFAPRLLWKKDYEIQTLRADKYRLERLIAIDLKPYMDKKVAADLEKQMYPRDSRKNGGNVVGD